MTALSNAQRQANYRNRKEANEFAREWGLGATPTVEEFMRARAESDTPRYIVYTYPSLDAGFCNSFYEELEKYNHVLTVENMLKAWKTVSKAGTAK